MSEIEERRAHPRFTCDLAATVAIAGAAAEELRCVDVSRGGICLRGQLDVPTKTEVTVSIRASWDGGETDALVLGGRVMWCSPVAGGERQLGVLFRGDLAEDVRRRLGVLLDLLKGRMDLPGTDSDPGSSHADDGDPAES